MEAYDRFLKERGLCGGDSYLKWTSPHSHATFTKKARQEMRDGFGLSLEVIAEMNRLKRNILRLHKAKKGGVLIAVHNGILDLKMEIDTDAFSGICVKVPQGLPADLVSRVVPLGNYSRGLIDGYLRAME